MVDLGWLLLLLTAFGGGVGLLTWMLLMRQRAQASGRWPTTTGTVIAADIDAPRNPDGPGRLYKAKVRYEYTVNGCRYEGDTVAFGDAYSLASAEAEETVRRYPVGATATVHYGPERPEVSALEPRVPGGNFA